MSESQSLALREAGVGISTSETFVYMNLWIYLSFPTHHRGFGALLRCPTHSGGTAVV